GCLPRRAARARSAFPRATPLRTCGGGLRGAGNPAEPLQEPQKARAIRQKLANANPAVTAFQSDLAKCHDHIGVVLSATGKPAEALQEYQKALAIQQKMADANPVVTEFQSDLAWSHNLLGQLHAREKRSTEAFPARAPGR